MLEENMWELGSSMKLSSYIIWHAFSFTTLLIIFS